VFTKYPSGEYRIDTSVVYEEITLRYEEGGFFDKLLLIGQLPYNVKKLIIPYWPYGREDKKYSTIDMVATINNLFKSFVSNVDTIVTYDLHSDAWINKTNLNLCNITQNNIWIRAIDDYLFINEIHEDDCVLVSPDKGSRDKIYKLSNDTNISTIVKGFKKREPSTGKITEIYIEPCKKSIEGSTAFVVDDICDGGGTFIPIAKQLRELGVKKLILIVTHGIFSNSTVKLIGVAPDKIYDELWTTNTYLSETVKTNIYYQKDYMRVVFVV